MMADKQIYQRQEELLSKAFPTSKETHRAPFVTTFKRAGKEICQEQEANCTAKAAAKVVAMQGLDGKESEEDDKSTKKPKVHWAAKRKAEAVAQGSESDGSEMGEKSPTKPKVKRTS